MAGSRKRGIANLISDTISEALGDVCVATPGKITAYYPTGKFRKTADVQPLIKRQFYDKAELPPIIPHVPVIQPRTAKAYSKLPVSAGDLVLLVFTDRSIDKYSQGKGDETDPGDPRTHDLSDAVAFVGFWPFLVAPPDESEDGADEDVAIGLVNPSAAVDSSVRIKPNGDVTVQALGSGSVVRLGSGTASRPSVPHPELGDWLGNLVALTTIAVQASNVFLTAVSNDSVITGPTKSAATTLITALTSYLADLVDLVADYQISVPNPKVLQ